MSTEVYESCLSASDPIADIQPFCDFARMKITVIFGIVLLPLAASSCSQEDASRDLPAPPERPSSQSQFTPLLAAELEGICGLPPGSLMGQTAMPEGELSKMACVFEEANKRNVPVGFISYPEDPDG